MDIIINAEKQVLPPTMLPILSQQHFYHNLLACLGYPISQPPIANLLARYHQLSGSWLIASPIYWEATHRDASIISCGRSLKLSDEASRRWFEALAGFVQPEHIKLHYHDAETWLIQSHQSPHIDTKPLHHMLNQSMMEPLRNLDPSLFWPLFITETQMFLNNHTLNRSRYDSCPINGLWIWGGGELESPQKRKIVCSDQELARLVAPLSTDIDTYQIGQRLDKNSILLLDDTSFVEHIARYIHKKTMRWYWNDLGYINPLDNWFTAIWRQISRIN